MSNEPLSVMKGIIKRISRDLKPDWKYIDQINKSLAYRWLIFSEKISMNFL